MVPAHIPMHSVWGNMAFPMLGFPIRRFPDQSLLTAPRNLSQSSTSFIGNIRLGIHLAPLSTFLCIDLTSNCYSQFLLPSIKNSISSHKLLTFSASLVWAHSSTRKIHASGLHSNSWIVFPHVALAQYATFSARGSFEHARNCLSTIQQPTGFCNSFLQDFSWFFVISADSLGNTLKTIFV